MEQYKVGVIGGGAWGTALGSALARGGNDVEIWALEQEVVDSINNQHENTMYLPNYKLFESIKATNDIKSAASDKDFILIASPSLFLVPTIKKFVDIPSIQSGKTIIGSLTKGFVPAGDDCPKLILETMESVLPEIYKDSTVYVAGPSHAEEVAMGKITGLISASKHHRNAVKMRDLLRTSSCIMAYASFDPIGVQICAAVKNVIATVYGMLDALSETSEIFGDNTESLLLAAGLSEIMKIGLSMGSPYPQTFVSISGVGDLDVTCKSKYGRNRRFGQDIIKTNILDNFENLDDLIANIKKVGYLPEGAVACKYVNQIAEKNNLKLPICEALYKLLNKEMSPIECLENLINRDNMKARPFKL